MCIGARHKLSSSQLVTNQTQAKLFSNKPKVSNMSTTKRRRTPMETKYSQWTPEKQMEHELTRNRMKV